MCFKVADSGSQNRFSSQPDVYKQFLEILQTYQRESKPIQDVYNQVTHLFKTAPDLLDDFKQFLPESAAAAKAHAARVQAEEQAMLSNVRGEPVYASPVVSREANVGTPNHGRGLPPVGNFAPTPLVKENNKRKRPGGREGTVGSATEGINGAAGVKGGQTGPAGKVSALLPLVNGGSEGSLVAPSRISPDQPRPPTLQHLTLDL